MSVKKEQLSSLESQTQPISRAATVQVQGFTLHVWIGKVRASGGATARVQHV